MSEVFFVNVVAIFFFILRIIILFSCVQKYNVSFQWDAGHSGPIQTLLLNKEFR